MRPRASGVLLPSILKSYFTSKSAQKRFIALEPWCILRSFASSLLPLLICASIFFYYRLYICFISCIYKLFPLSRSLTNSNNNNNSLNFFVYSAAIKIYYSICFILIFLYFAVHVHLCCNFKLLIKLKVSQCC